MLINPMRVKKRIAYMKRRLLQLRSHFAWRLHANTLDGEFARIASELHRDGIALTDVGRLGLEDLFAELCQAVEGIRHVKRSEMKPFLIKLLADTDVKHDPDSVFARLAMHPQVLQIANAYLECFCGLSAYNVWKNVPMGDAPVSSQLWHRDPGDSRLLKMFVAVSDIEDDRGPFYFAKGTHGCGAYRDFVMPGASDGMALRASDDDIGGHAEMNDRIKVTGPAGTVFFADTFGVHKGGNVLREHRTLFVAQYVRWHYNMPTEVTTDRSTQFTRHNQNTATRWASRAFRSVGAK